MTPGLRIGALWIVVIVIATLAGAILVLVRRTVARDARPEARERWSREPLREGDHLSDDGEEGPDTGVDDPPGHPPTNPFYTLEALGEHIDALWYQLAEQDVIVRRLDDNMPHPYPVGTVGYHLAAVEAYTHSLFQQMVTLLPDLYRQSEAPDNDEENHDDAAS